MSPLHPSRRRRSGLATQYQWHCQQPLRLAGAVTVTVSVPGPVVQLQATDLKLAATHDLKFKLVSLAVGSESLTAITVTITE